MTNLRKEARGRGCMVRIPEVCNCNSETVVLAHVRIAGISGMGLKAPDLLGAWACSACHDAIDRRAHLDLDRDYVRLLHLEGMARTINQLLKENLI
jgi:hypothetical protein